jgi:hypothetical protein
MKPAALDDELKVMPVLLSGIRDLKFIVRHPWT